MEDRARSQKHGKFLYGETTDKIIQLAMKVHRKLGPGFIERIYEKALSYELHEAGLTCERQKSLSVAYEGLPLGEQRVDMVVEDKVIVELKAVSELNRVHQAQMISYLKAAEKRVGLILNFAKPKLEIKRIVN